MTTNATWHLAPWGNRRTACGATPGAITDKPEAVTCLECKHADGVRLGFREGFQSLMTTPNESYQSGYSAAAIVERARFDQELAEIADQIEHSWTTPNTIAGRLVAPTITVALQHAAKLVRNRRGGDA